MTEADILKERLRQDSDWLKSGRVGSRIPISTIIDEALARIEALETQVLGERAICEGRDRLLGELHEHIATLEVENSELKNTRTYAIITTLEAENKTLKNRIEMAQANNKRLREELDELYNERHLFVQQSATIAAENKRLRATIEAIDREFDRAEVKTNE